MTESKLFVFDTAKETNISCLTPYSALLYVIRKLLVISGKIFDVSKHASSSFKPIKLELDDHSMIVRHKENLSTKRMNKVIDIIISQFHDAKLVNVGELIKK